MPSPVTQVEIDPRTLVEVQLRKGKSISEVAKLIGYSRSALSLYIAGRYPSKSSGRLETAILAALTDTILCPHLERPLSEDECGAFRRRSMPKQSSDELKHWFACQRCPFNTKDQEGGACHAA